MIEDLADKLRLRKGHRFVNEDRDVPVQPARLPDLTDPSESGRSNRSRRIHVDLDGAGVWLVGGDAAQRFPIVRMNGHGRMVREVSLGGYGPEQPIDVVLRKIAVVAMAKR